MQIFGICQYALFQAKMEDCYVYSLDAWDYGHQPQDIYFVAIIITVCMNFSVDLNFSKPSTGNFCCIA